MLKKIILAIQIASIVLFTVAAVLQFQAVSGYNDAAKSLQISQDAFNKALKFYTNLCRKRWVMQLWCNGSIRAFQAFGAGSTPASCSKNRKVMNMSKSSENTMSFEWLNTELRSLYDAAIKANDTALAFSILQEVRYLLGHWSIIRAQI